MVRLARRLRGVSSIQRAILTRPPSTLRAMTGAYLIMCGFDPCTHGCRSCWLEARNGFHDERARLSTISPSSELYPFAALKILIVAKEVRSQKDRKKLLLDFYAFVAARCSPIQRTQGSPLFTAFQRRSSAVQHSHCRNSASAR